MIIVDKDMEKNHSCLLTFADYKVYWHICCKQVGRFLEKI